MDCWLLQTTLQKCGFFSHSYAFVACATMPRFCNVMFLCFDSVLYSKRWPFFSCKNQTHRTVFLEVFFEATGIEVIRMFRCFKNKKTAQKTLFYMIPGSSKCVKIVPFHPKNLPKGRNFTIWKTQVYYIYFDLYYSVCSSQMVLILKQHDLL